MQFWSVYLFVVLKILVFSMSECLLRKISGVEGLLTIKVYWKPLRFFFCTFRILNGRKHSCSWRKSRKGKFSIHSHSGLNRRYNEFWIQYNLERWTWNEHVINTWLYQRLIPSYFKVSANVSRTCWYCSTVCNEQRIFTSSSCRNGIVNFLAFHIF